MKAQSLLAAESPGFRLCRFDIEQANPALVPQARRRNHDEVPSSPNPEPPKP